MCFKVTDIVSLNTWVSKIKNSGPTGKLSIFAAFVTPNRATRQKAKPNLRVNEIIQHSPLLCGLNIKHSDYTMNGCTVSSDKINTTTTIKQIKSIRYLTIVQSMLLILLVRNSTDSTGSYELEQQLGGLWNYGGDKLRNLLVRGYVRDIQAITNVLISAVFLIGPYN